MLFARPGNDEAESRTSFDNWQPLLSHLLDVSAIALQLARRATSDVTFHSMARATGFLHDVGKAREEWQQMLVASVD